MAGADLSGLDLSGMDLSRVLFFRESRGAGWWAAACLENANLENASLQFAHLQWTNLAKADLRYANLTHAILAHAHLEQADLQNAVLDGATFSEANLTGASLGSANLSRTNLAQVVFSGADLWGVDLRWSFLPQADLQDAALGAAKLDGADLRRATMQRADLRSASLIGCNLARADLQDANLTNAKLKGADLRFVDLRQRDLLDNGSLHGVRFHRARLEGTRLSKEQLGGAIGDEQAGHHLEARAAYLALKNNFETQGDYEAASWCYLKERKMERISSAPWRARAVHGAEQLGESYRRRLPAYNPRVWWFYVRHSTKWLGDLLVELVCGYGERPWRTLATMASLFAFFLWLYWATGAVVRIEHPSQPETRVVTHNLADLVIFGLSAFTTMDTARLQPAAPWVEFAVSVEAILGIFLTGLLGFVVANRIRRS